MLISVGYSSCHWCHVMEKEVFSNNDVAEFMNENYVCVKVDREERPDVDHIYMNAVQIITRSGGWPLNCFATPEGKPIFGGTYFPRDKWMDILISLKNTWESDPQRVLEVADELTQGVMQTEIIAKANNEKEFTFNELKEYVGNWTKYFDLRFGSHKGSPKFPMPGSLQFLLNYSMVTNDSQIKDHVELTLSKMLRGGIYDHLGGGFFRYSVDERWEVPHFEKMLYDNAQLVSLYSDAYRLAGNSFYRDAVYQTIDFLRKELRSADGGFYSAIDADSEGEEGKYYTWSKSDIDAILGEDSEMFSIAYGVSASGDLHGKSVLRVAASYNETACVLALDADTVALGVSRAKSKLLKARAVRTRPLTDDKHILSWNALAISALAKAYIVFKEKTFLDDANACARFIEKKLVQSDGTLLRIHCKGTSSIPAFLDDYANLTQAYLSLYIATFDEEWLIKSKRLIEIAISKFYDNGTGMFFFSKPEHDNLIVRKMELTDGVIPSSSAIMAENLIVLSVYFRNEKFLDMATQMLKNISDQLKRSGPFVYKWAEVYLKHLAKPVEVFCSGTDAAEKLLKVMANSNFPYIIPFNAEKNSNIPISSLKLDEGMLKLCHGKTCQKPTGKEEEVINYINSLGF